jgi:putative nucleotidyltransferase with HDIG domain
VIAQSQILDNMKRLPTISPVISSLYRVLNDERSSARDVERVIKPDVALTANLLRVANSAFFGCPSTVSSVRQAVFLMGSKQVYEAAVAAMFSKALPDVLPGYGMDAGRLWQHSAAVAILGRHLAEELGFKAPDLIFTAGLLHDVGKLAISAFLAEAIDEVRDRVGRGKRTLVAAEKEVLGVDHAEVGALLARRWRLPDPIVEVVRWHHAPSGAEGKGDQQLVDLVQAANCLAHSLGYGSDVGGLARSVAPEVVQRLGIKVQRLESVACATLDAVQDMARLSGGAHEHEDKDNRWRTTS